MKRRIFIAIDLPPDIEAKVAQAVSRWRWLPIRWLDPDNWHITLVPPVYLTDAEFRLLLDALKRGRLGRAFTLRFSKIMLAPPGRPSRMVWLFGDAPPELSRLAERCRERWSAVREIPRPEPESRPLALHATLARFEPGELTELEQKTKVLAEVDFGFRAREVAVMESHLSPQGAQYETIAVIRLSWHGVRSAPAYR